MKLNDYLEYMKNSKTDASVELVYRVCKAYEAEGGEFEHILCCGTKGSTHKVGERYLGVDRVWKHNAAEQNVSAVIVVMECNGITKYGCSSKRIGKIKVPANASDKVIAKRIAAAVEMMNNRGE